MNGGYLAHQIRQRTIQPVLAFREYIFRDVLPQFHDLNARADKVGQEFYDRAVSQPASEDFDGDLSGFAEDAQDHALGWYQMMRSLQQTMLNLLAAGLFHLTEQQLGSLAQDVGFDGRRPRESKLDVLERWYERTFDLDLKALTDYPSMDELRLVANTTKHAEGGSCAQLRSRRPDLFVDPSLSGTFDDSGFKDYLVSRPVAAPLAGEDLFITEAALQGYAEAVEQFFRDIAAHFEQHEDKYY